MLVVVLVRACNVESELADRRFLNTNFLVSLLSRCLSDCLAADGGCDFTLAEDCADGGDATTGDDEEEAEEADKAEEEDADAANSATTAMVGSTTAIVFVDRGRFFGLRELVNGTLS